MKIIETGPREIGFVLWGHCQNLLDDPRTKQSRRLVLENFISVLYSLFSRKTTTFYGLCSWVWGLQNIVPLLPACHFHTMCKIRQLISRPKLLLAHGGGVIFYKKIPDFHIFLHFADAQIYA